MTLKRPSWFKDVKERVQPKDQITIIMSPRGLNSTSPVEQPIGPIPNGPINPTAIPMPTGPTAPPGGLDNSQASRNMNNAPEGTIAGYVHGGENVINAQASKAMDPETLSVINSGKFDLEKLRAALGLPPLPGYATGGAVQPLLGDPIEAQNSVSKTNIANINLSRATTGTLDPHLAAENVQSSSNAINSNIAKGASSIIAALPPAGPVQSKPTMQQQTFQPNAVAPVESGPIQTTPIQSNMPAPSGPAPNPNLPATAATPTAPATNALTAQEQYQNQLLTGTALSQAAGGKALQHELKAGGASSGATATALEANARVNAVTNAQNVSALSSQNLANLQNFQALDTNNMNNYSTQVTTSVQTDINGGKTASQISSDPSLIKAETNLLKLQLGRDPTSAEVTGAISTLVNATMMSESGTANTDMSSRMANINSTGSQTGVPVAQQISNAQADPNIVKDAQIFLGPNATPQQVKDYIASQFNTLAQSPVTSTINLMKSQGLIPTADLATIQNNPTANSDFMSAVQSMLSSGMITNTNGVLTVTSAGQLDLPWNNPATWADFNNFNGKPVAGGAAATDPATAIVNATGAPVLSNGKAVTNGQMSTAWQTLLNTNPSAASTYFNTDGSFNATAFAASTWMGGNPLAGATNPLTNSTTDTPQQLLQAVMGNTSLNTALQATQGDMLKVLPALDVMVNPTVTNSQGAPTIGGTGAVLNTNKAIFSYYTSAGQQLGDMTGKGSTIFNELLTQMSSSKLNPHPGTILSAQDFNNLWGDGNQYTVSIDGSGNATITNLNNPGDKSSITSQVSPTIQTLIKSVVSNNDGSSIPISSQLTLDHGKLIGNNFSSVPSSSVASGGAFYLEKLPGTSDWTNAGLGGYEQLNSDVNKWVTSNEGKLYQAQNGRVYMVMGVIGGSVALQDVVSGTEVDYALSGDRGHIVSNRFSENGYDNTNTTYLQNTGS